MTVTKLPDDQATDVISAMYSAGVQGITYTDRRTNQHAGWPHPTLEVQSRTAAIYEAARSAAAVGSPTPRIDHTTQLHTHVWEREATGHPKDTLVLEGLKCGFPIQYKGPPLLKPTSMSTSQRRPILEHWQAHSSLPHLPLGSYRAP